LRVIGKAVDSLVNFKAPGAHWADDPYLFAEAAKVMNVMLQMLRPTGEPPEKTMGYGPPRQGEFAVTETLRALQVVDTSVPFKKQTARQRELTMLRGDLGDLADRPRPRGYSAEENRQMRRLIEQLAPLRRKDESTLTAKERERMNALWAQLEAIKPGEKK
jgi:hypothetical protein